MDGFGAHSSGAMKRLGPTRQVNLLNKESVVIVLQEDRVVFQLLRDISRVRDNMILVPRKELWIPFGAAASTKRRKLH